MRGFFFSFSAGNWRDKERNSVSRGRGRSAATEEQVERKWARELEGGWERERGRGGARIAFLLHQFRVTRFEDAGSDILIGFALTSLPPHTHTHLNTHIFLIHTHTHTHNRQFCSATWLARHSHLAPVATFPSQCAREKQE